MSQLPCLRCSRLLSISQTSKTTYLRIQIRQICTPHWSECSPILVLQMSNVASWDYCMGTIGMNMVCQDLCAGCCKPFLPLQSFRSPVIEPHPYPWNPCSAGNSRGSCKATHNARDACCPSEFYFPTGGTGTQERPLCVVYDSLVRGNAVNVQPLLLLSMSWPLKYRVVL